MVFVEKGESAKFLDRTELLKLIEFCRKRKDIGMLIVWKVDRLARNVGDHLAIKAELAKYGTAVCSVTEPIDDSPVGKMTEMILAVFAEFDNAIRALRSKGGMQSKIKSGIYPLRPPLGYLSANPKGTKKTIPDVPDPERFSTISETLRLVLAKALTKAEAVRFFQSRHLTLRNGKPVTAKHVDKIFRNPYYAGILVDPSDGKEYPGKHQAMVTPEEFAQIQRNLSRRANSQPHIKDRSEFPLRGFVRCCHCLRPLTGGWSRGRRKRYPYYHCYSKPCGRRTKGVPRERLETEFVNHLGRYIPRQQLIPVLEKRIRAQWSALHAGQERRVKKQRFQLQTLENENTELIQMRRRNLISDAEFSRDHTTLSYDIQATRAVLGDMQAAAHFDDKDVDNVLNFLRVLPANWSKTTPAFRRRFQNMMFYEGLIEGRFRTAKKSDIFTVIERFEHANGKKVDLSAKFLNRLIPEFSKVAALIRSCDPFIEDENGPVQNSGTQV